MPRKDPEQRREYQQKYFRKWYAANKEKHIAYIRISDDRRMERVMAVVGPIKDGPCMDCGQRFPRCAMDFDHVRGKKRNDVSTMITGRNMALTSVLEEIEKCDLVCANCHRIRTHKRRVVKLHAQ